MNHLNLCRGNFAEKEMKLLDGRKDKDSNYKFYLISSPEHKGPREQSREDFRDVDKV